MKKKTECCLEHVHSVAEVMVWDESVVSGAARDQEGYQLI